MKKSVLPLLLLSLMALSGCVFRSQEGNSRNVYDLSPEFPQCQKAVHRIRISDLSGADRRFLYRKEGNLIVADERNCWLFSPEQMLKRTFDMVFADRSSDAANILCRIERFEFDLPGKSANLRLAVTFEKAGKSVTKVFTEKEKFTTASSAASAMDKCVRRAMKNICAAYTVSGGIEK